MYSSNEANHYEILCQPLINEKTIKIGDKCNQVAFIVKKDSSKKDIKSAVEYIFKVPVKSVQVVNVKEKYKRFGKKNSKKSSRKKAYVSLQKGYELSFVDLRI